MKRLLAVALCVIRAGGNCSQCNTGNHCQSGNCDCCMSGGGC